MLRAQGKLSGVTVTCGSEGGEGSGGFVIDGSCGGSSGELYALHLAFGPPPPLAPPPLLARSCECQDFVDKVATQPSGTGGSRRLCKHLTAMLLDAVATHSGNARTNRQHGLQPTAAAAAAAACTVDGPAR